MQCEDDNIPPLWSWHNFGRMLIHLESSMHITEKCCLRLSDAESGPVTVTKCDDQDEYECHLQPYLQIYFNSELCHSNQLLTLVDLGTSEGIVLAAHPEYMMRKIVDATKASITVLTQTKRLSLWQITPYKSQTGRFDICRQVY